jgi:hypothetical protein
MWKSQSDSIFPEALLVRTIIESTQKHGCPPLVPFQHMRVIPILAIRDQCKLHNPTIPFIMQDIHEPAGLVPLELNEYPGIIAL